MPTAETGGGTKPARKRSAETSNVPEQPLSPRIYAGIAGAGLLFAALLAVVLVLLAPRLNASGQGNLVFYLLLIPCSLSCAAFLFGAMRSYAHWTGKAMNGKLELTGPVVIFCLVLYGGYKLLPQAQSTFDLKVRPVAAGQQAVTSGSIKLLASDANAEMSSSIVDGYARFEKLPSQLKHATVQLEPEVDGFSEDAVAVPLKDSDTVDLPLKEARFDLTVTVMPPPGKVPLWVKTVDKDNSAQTAKVDTDGTAKFNVAGEAGDTVEVGVYCSGVAGPAVENHYVLGNDISINLADRRCTGK